MVLISITSDPNDFLSAPPPQLYISRHHHHQPGHHGGGGGRAPLHWSKPVDDVVQSNGNNDRDNKAETKVSSTHQLDTDNSAATATVVNQHNNNNNGKSVIFLSNNQLIHGNIDYRFSLRVIFLLELPSCLK